MTISTNTRQRVVVLLTAVALTLALLFVIALGSGDAGASVGDDRPTISHLVRTGDTLWDIAAATADPGADLRTVVEDIKRANGLTSSLITPGQVLVVPLSG